MMTNLSHCLNGRHQTNYQAAPHHPLAPIRGYLGVLSFMTGDPIFKPKIEQRVNYVFTFCAWQRWDRGAEIH